MNRVILENKNGMRAEVLDFGAVIRRITLPPEYGGEDVVCGFADTEDYRDNPCYTGALIGPSAGRIRGACFSIGGESFYLPANAGSDNLHSGTEEGFHKRVWEFAEITACSCILRLSLTHLDAGFPGNRVFTVSYTLTDDNALRLDINAETDRPTLINPTLHAYFRLDPHQDTILSHRALFYASRFVPADERLLSSGEFISVSGTPFDFTHKKEIGRDIAIDNEQLKLAGGYDHFFETDGALDENRVPTGKLLPCAEITAPETGITLDVSTTLPGFLFYTGNYYSLPSDVTGREVGKHGAFCIETQFPPDAVHIPSFPQPVYDKDHPYHSTTIYRFSH